MENSTLSQSSYNILLPFSIAYFCIFLFGSIGNGIVIVMIMNVLSSIHKSKSKNRMTTTSHVFIYVLGLSIVDLLVLIHLPFLIFEMWNKSFPFGNALCKLYWFGESVNKLLSSFLMCVLSWDRYLAVCKPVNSISIRSNSVALLVLFCSFTLAIILLLPVLLQAQVTMVDRLSIQVDKLDYGTPEYDLAVTRGSLISKCSFDPDSIFVLYTFSMGFVIPALLITFFYAQVIIRLRSNSRNMFVDHKQSDANGGRSSISSRVHQVTKRIVMVIFFYFVCWTPQWTITLLINFELLEYNQLLLLISLSAHVLVCFNSAANPLLYALINRQLRAQHVQAMARKRQSITAATQVVFDDPPHGVSGVSVDGIPHTALSLLTRIRLFLAGFKVNLFSSGPFKKRSVSRSSSNRSQISNVQAKESITIGSKCQLKRDESIFLTTQDDYL